MGQEGVFLARLEVANNGPKATYRSQLVQVGFEKATAGLGWGERAEEAVGVPTSGRGLLNLARLTRVDGGWRVEPVRVGKINAGGYGEEYRFHSPRSLPAGTSLDLEMLIHVDEAPAVARRVRVRIWHNMPGQAQGFLAKVTELTDEIAGLKLPGVGDR